MSLINLSNENFKDLLVNKKVLVDFYADWCGPCKMLGPVLEELSTEGVEIIKVNVDNHQALAEEYKVTSIPALFVIDNGNIVKQELGFMPKEKLQALLK